MDVLLAGGTLPKIVFWQVHGWVDIGTTIHMEGAVPTPALVRMKTGSSINGRLLAQTVAALKHPTVVPSVP